MPFTERFEAAEPERSQIDETQGPVVLEFGTSWCGYCQAAQPLIAEAFAEVPEPRHIKIEDGKGRRFGRSFSVKRRSWICWA
jgi:thioredoxin 1